MALFPLNLSELYANKIQCLTLTGIAFCHMHRYPYLIVIEAMSLVTTLLCTSMLRNYSVVPLTSSWLRATLMEAYQFIQPVIATAPSTCPLYRLPVNKSSVTVP